MTRRRQVEKLDSTHKPIVLALRGIGVYVFETAGVGGGWPDLVAVKDGVIKLVECKDGNAPPSQRRLTPAQEKFHADMLRNGVEVYTVGSVDEALALFGARVAA